MSNIVGILENISLIQNRKQNIGKLVTVIGAVETTKTIEIESIYDELIKFTNQLKTFLDKNKNNNKYFDPNYNPHDPNYETKFDHATFDILNLNSILAKVQTNEKLMVQEIIDTIKSIAYSTKVDIDKPNIFDLIMKEVADECDKPIKPCKYDKKRKRTTVTINGVKEIVHEEYISNEV